MVKIGRRGGKTELALNELIKQAVTRPGLYWYIAPSYRQAKTIAWTRLKSLLEPAKDMWKFNEQELYAEEKALKTRIELRGADNEESLLGVGLNGVVMDECAMIKDQVWPRIIRPMLADTQGWALFISTPKGRNWFFDIFSAHEEDWQSWSYPTTVNAFVPMEEVDAAKRDMSERLFRQEFMAEFLDEDTGVFKGIAKCASGMLSDPVSGRFYVVGVDLAKTVDFTVITVMDSVNRHVVYFERFQDVSWQVQKARIQEIAFKYNNAMCVVDATGLGDPIVEDLRNGGVSVEPFKFSVQSKHELVERLAIALEQRQITFPHNLEHLYDELMRYEYQITKQGNVKYGAPEGRHDDCVISLGLAVWGLRFQLHEAQVVKKDEVLLSAQDRQGLGELERDNEYIDSPQGGY